MKQAAIEGLFVNGGMAVKARSRACCEFQSNTVVVHLEASIFPCPEDKNVVENYIRGDESVLGVYLLAADTNTWTDL